MILLAAVLTSPKSPNADFARCVATMRRTISFAVKADVHSVTSVSNTYSSSTLAIHSPIWASLELHKGPAAGNGAIDWQYEVHGRMLRGLDSTRRGYIQRQYPKSLAAVPMLFVELGGLIPDPTLKMMSPTALERFLGTFSKLTGWTRSVEGDTVRWKDHSKRGDLVFGFSRSSGRMTEWRISALGAVENWNFTYMAPDAVAPFVIPGDATLVSKFRLPTRKPRFRDPNTEKVVSSCFDAYETLLPMSVKITEGGSTIQVWRSRGVVSQLSPAGGWRWDHGSLTMWAKDRGVYQGKCRIKDLTTYLGLVKLGAEPIAISFARDENFASKLFTFEYGVKTVGDVELDGVPQHVVQLFGPAVKVDLGIDDKGLVRRIDSTAYDSNGHALSESIRVFSYEAGGEAPEPPATNPKPLPKLPPPPKRPPLKKASS